MNFEQMGYLFGKVFLLLLIFYFGIKMGRKIGAGMRKKQEAEGKENEKT